MRLGKPWNETLKGTQKPAPCNLVRFPELMSEVTSWKPNWEFPTNLTFLYFGHRIITNEKNTYQSLCRDINPSAFRPLTPPLISPTSSTFSLSHYQTSIHVGAWAHAGSELVSAVERSDLDSSVAQCSGAVVAPTPSAPTPLVNMGGRPLLHLRLCQRASSDC